MDKDTAAASLITFLVVLWLGGIHSAARASADDVWFPLPRCVMEDGSDVDGACAWVDPDTGKIYINPTAEEISHA